MATGCAIGKGVKEVPFNGQMLYEAKCNGTARTYSDCLEQASEKCAEIHKQVVTLNQDRSSTFTTYNGQLMPIVNRSIVFKCE